MAKMCGISKPRMDYIGERSMAIHHLRPFARLATNFRSVVPDLREPGFNWGDFNRLCATTLAFYRRNLNASALGDATVETVAGLSVSLSNETCNKIAEQLEKGEIDLLSETKLSDLLNEEEDTLPYTNENNETTDSFQFHADSSEVDALCGASGATASERVPLAGTSSDGQPINAKTRAMKQREKMKRELREGKEKDDETREVRRELQKTKEELMMKTGEVRELKEEQKEKEKHHEEELMLAKAAKQNVKKQSNNLKKK